MVEEIKNLIKKINPYAGIMGIIISLFGAFLYVLRDLCAYFYSLGNLKHWGIDNSYIDLDVSFYSIISSIGWIAFALVTNIIIYYIVISDIIRPVKLIAGIVFYCGIIAVIFLVLCSGINFEPIEILNEFKSSPLRAKGYYLLALMLAATPFLVLGLYKGLSVQWNRYKERQCSQPVRIFPWLPIDGLIKKITSKKINRDNLSKREETSERQEKDNEEDKPFVPIAAALCSCFLVIIISFTSIAYFYLGRGEAQRKTEFKLIGEAQVIIYETQDDYIIAECKIEKTDSKQYIHINTDKQEVDHKDSIQTVLKHFDYVQIYDDAEFENVKKSR